MSERGEASPALTEQSEIYPASWYGRVPKRVRMAKTVTSDLPLVLTGYRPLEATRTTEYGVWVNRNGAVAAILPSGERLGLKPYEFEVIEWHTK